MQSSEASREPQPEPLNPTFWLILNCSPDCVTPLRDEMSSELQLVFHLPCTWGYLFSTRVHVVVLRRLVPKEAPTERGCLIPQHFWSQTAS